MKDLGGRPLFDATQERRELVKKLAGYGIPQSEIAATIGCSIPTLALHFAEELVLGRTEANAKVAGFLFKQAEEGSTSAAIFWLKVRALWREPKPEDDAHDEGLNITGGLPDAQT